MVLALTKVTQLYCLDINNDRNNPLIRKLLSCEGITEDVATTLYRTIHNKTHKERNESRGLPNPFSLFEEVTIYSDDGEELFRVNEPRYGTSQLRFIVENMGEETKKLEAAMRTIGTYKKISSSEEIRNN